MSRSEIVKLYNLQQKIVEQSNKYYQDKRVVKKDDLAMLSRMLKVAEDLFPNYIVLLHSEKSERIYVSPNVKGSLNYSPASVINFSDFEFLENIHPDDVRPVRKVMEQIYELGKQENYDHTSIRYTMNLRYKMDDSQYAHILYEAITIEYEGHFADLVLVKNITHEQPFQHVGLTVFKRTNSGLVRLLQFIPDQKGKLLTPREKDIIQLLSKGFSNDRIADTLGISISTVKNHRGKLFRKLNVRNSLQLMNYARKESII